MYLDPTKRELSLKIVYYGPPMSGKTTNIEWVYKSLTPQVRGHLTTLDTADDRTLFFDMLPVQIDASSGVRVRLKLYTVPGQVIHAATRRVVLTGADGVVFVADSRHEAGRNNNEYWHGMCSYLRQTGVEPDAIPLVVQFNKCDLPDARSHDDIEKMRLLSAEPIYEAVAVRGQGVVETLAGLLRLVFDKYEAAFGLAEKLGVDADGFAAMLTQQLVGAAKGGEGGPA